MKLFLFEWIEHVSSSYHDDGGLVVVANDETHAREIIAKSEYARPSADEWGEVKVYELATDYEPALFVFPDAGCC